jgi:hypothetical protein
LDYPRFIHIYQIASSRVFDAKVVAEEINEILPSCKIDIRPPFKYEEKMIEHAKISNIKQPFEKQTNHERDNKMIMRRTTMISLYDGFVMQNKLAEMIPTAEISLAHIHIIFTGLLTCTFSEDDWRYHGRALICGTPSIVSTTGIVEALAKPREFYLAQLFEGMSEDNDMLKKKFAGRFIDYDEEGKITAASINYALQAIFFFITSGEPFCNNKDCRLFNAHWQEDLIHTIKKRTLCSHHMDLANKLSKAQPKTGIF